MSNVPNENDPNVSNPVPSPVPQPGAAPVHENDPRLADDPSRINQPELDPNRPEAGRWEDVRSEEANTRYGDARDDSELYEPVPDEDSVAQTEEIAFLHGNRNTPVLLLGDDPSNDANETDNVLVVPLGTAVSVPRSSVSKDEGTPEV